MDTVVAGAGDGGVVAGASSGVEGGGGAAARRRRCVGDGEAGLWLAMRHVVVRRAA